MGIGFVLAVPADVDKVLATVEANGEKAYKIGRVVKAMVLYSMAHMMGSLV